MSVTTPPQAVQVDPALEKDWNDFASQNAGSGITVRTNADGSHTVLTNKRNNGLYESYTWPAGSNGHDGAKATQGSVQSDGVTPVKEASPNEAARNGGSGSLGNGTLGLGPIADALGLGSPATPGSPDAGSNSNPNPAFLSAKEAGTSSDLLTQEQQDRANQANTRSGQNKLLGSYNETINDPNASSVAKTQLAINNDNNTRSALGSAAGVGGANAFAARRQAMNNITVGNIGTAQNSALARAKEVQDAQSGSNAVLGTMSTADSARQASDLAGASAFDKTAAENAQKIEEEKMKAREETKSQNQTFFNRLTNAASSGMAGGLGGSGGA